MKKNLFALFLFISSLSIAQHTIQGYLSPNIKSDWLILYRVESTKEVFVNNTSIVKDSLIVNGRELAVGSFKFVLPSTSKPGTYRITYKSDDNGFLDFIYNNEDVEFIFNPEYAELSVAFTKSEENKFYKNYLDDITKAQEKIDSIQVAYIKNSKLDLSRSYTKALTEFNTLQNKFEDNSKGMIVNDFIKANPRTNSSSLLLKPESYLNTIKNTFFDKLDFSNQNLKNSSFLTNRILDYIFYINFTNDEKKQQNLYKTSIKTVLSKIESDTYKKEIIEFLIEQFEEQKNVEIVDYLFDEHYNSLPKNFQNLKFKEDKKALLAAEVGRIAPDFSWKEKGVSYTLSSLSDAENYVLVFWSTGCSHCLREIPKLYSYMQTKPKMKVISFALEKDDFVWQQYSNTKLIGWHNVLGLNKWDNKIGRTYQINSTPTFFILDKNKKIISKPYSLEDLQSFIEKLKM